MKTLIVEYLPRKENSNTGKILNAFKEKIVGETQTLDLLQDPPEFLDTQRVLAYVEQNYMGKELAPEDKEVLTKMETLATAVKEANFVVLATPMYNFSFPALVKAWLDSVMYKGITWTTDQAGTRGLCTEGKAALIFASGGTYTGESEGWNHLTPIVAQSFGFMGFGEFNTVTAGGIPIGADSLEIISQAQQEARDLADSWYTEK